MRIVVEMDIDFEEMDELSNEERVVAVHEMIESGAESYNMFVNVIGAHIIERGSLCEAK